MTDTKDKDIGWIETYSGKQFYLNGTDTESIVIEDIAHALAHICRYNGHTNRFYSVAEHSVLVSYAVPKPYALWGLMHDASEAYLSDIPRPFKAMIANYKSLEANVMGRIAKRFGMDGTEPAIVKNADSAMLYPEARFFMRSEGTLWADINTYRKQFFAPIDSQDVFSPSVSTILQLNAPNGLLNWRSDTFDFPALSPEKAKMTFLTRFLELKGF